MGVVADYAEQAHQLDAEERLGFIMDVAAGTGNLKKTAHRRHMRDLKRRAAGKHAQQGSTAPDAVGAFTASAQAMGIQVIVDG